MCVKLNPDYNGCVMCVVTDAAKAESESVIAHDHQMPQTPTTGKKPSI